MMLSLAFLFLGAAHGSGLFTSGANHPRDFSPRAEASKSDVVRRIPATGQLITTCTQPGVVALTFDDGPYVYTSRLLDVLASYGAKATFFLAGNNYGRIMNQGDYPAILQRANAEGHQLASHTYSHQDLSLASSAVRYQEMQANEDLFVSVLGKYPTYMRPPYLSCTAESGCIADLTNMGYHIINCDVDTKDYENDSPDKIHVSKELFDAQISDSPASSSHIVLAHDVHEQTVASLAAYMIESLRAKGYRAVTVGECLGDAPENWYRYH